MQLSKEIDLLQEKIRSGQVKPQDGVSSCLWLIQELGKLSSESVLQTIDELRNAIHFLDKRSIGLACESLRAASICLRDGLAPASGHSVK